MNPFRETTNPSTGILCIPLLTNITKQPKNRRYAVKKLGRYYFANLLVQACSLAGTACLCSLSTTTPHWNTYVYLAVAGTGYGGAYVTRLMGLLSAAGQDQQAVLHAASWTINSLGNSIGLAVASSVFRHLYVGPLTALLEHDGGLAYRTTLAALLDGNFQGLSLLPGHLQAQVVQAYLQAVWATFYMVLGFTVLASGSSFRMEDNRLWALGGRTQGFCW